MMPTVDRGRYWQDRILNPDSVLEPEAPFPAEHKNVPTEGLRGAISTTFRELQKFKDEGPRGVAETGVDLLAGGAIDAINNAANRGQDRGVVDDLIVPTLETLPAVGLAGRAALGVGKQVAKGLRRAADAPMTNPHRRALVTQEQRVSPEVTRETPTTEIARPDVGDVEKQKVSSSPEEMTSLETEPFVPQGDPRTMAIPASVKMGKNSDLPEGIFITERGEKETLLRFGGDFDPQAPLISPDAPTIPFKQIQEEHSIFRKAIKEID